MRLSIIIILGWNDLGMHCANKDFSKIAILPPYNNLKTQVILKGDASSFPQVVTSGLSVTYEVPGNTYSVGKTNFWSYSNALFGVTLAPNIGLTGAALSGNMAATGNVFEVFGVPLTPHPDTDLINQHPYQLALMKVFDQNNNLLASTQNVIPVSNEISCVSSGCHSSEQDILDSHETVSGFNINGPNLCASCHADNALGTTGTPGTPNLSYAIHRRHQSMTNNCYKCHPGVNTNCFRDTMFAAGMTCQSCHGSVQNVASTIAAGRQPWLQEPTCGAVNCHGSNYAEEPNLLFRQSKGHGGLFCSACHGSPHAIVPTVQPNDNLQNLTLQGYTGQLNKCVVCHGVNPSSPGPHGAFPTDIEQLTDDYNGLSDLKQNYPNPASEMTVIPFTIGNRGKYRIEAFDSNGKRIALMVSRDFQKGSYQTTFNTSFLANGVYILSLSSDNFHDYKRMLISR